MNKYILIAAIMLVAKGAKGQDVWEVPTDNSTNNTEMKAAKGNKTENGTTKTSLTPPIPQRGGDGKRREGGLGAQHRPERKNRTADL